MHDASHGGRISTPWLLLLSLAIPIQTASCQEIFIAQVPEYSQLSSCAQGQVGTIVRDMSRGCRDGSKTGSPSCFCAASSREFESIVSAAVKSACSGAEENVTAALNVIHKFCELGIKARAVRTSTVLSSIASGSVSITTLLLDNLPTPIPSPSSYVLAEETTTAPSSTSSQTCSSQSSPSACSSTASTASPLSPPALVAIGAGCAVFLGIALFAAVRVFYHRRRMRARPAASDDTISDSHPDTEDHSTSRSHLHPVHRDLSWDAHWRRMGGYPVALRGHPKDADGVVEQSPPACGNPLVVEAGGEPVVFYELPTEGCEVDIRKLADAKHFDGSGDEKQPPSYTASTEDSKAGIELPQKH